MRTGLSGSTKTYTAYGRSKRHVTNRLVSDWADLDDDAPRAPVAPPSPSSSSTTTDSESESDVEPTIVLKTAARNAALEAIKAKRQAKASPTALQHKENRPAAHDKVLPKSQPKLAVKQAPKRPPVISDGAKEAGVDGNERPSPKSGVRAILADKGGKKAVKGSRTTVKPIQGVKGKLGGKATPSPTRTINVLQDPSESLLVDEVTFPTLPESSMKGKGSTVAKVKRGGKKSSVSEDSGVELSFQATSAADVLPTETAAPRRSRRSDTLSIPSPPQSPALAALPIPPYLAPLLSLTTSPTLSDFTAFVATPPAPFGSAPWRKLGEASYAEVYTTLDAQGRDIVVKIIPITLSGAADAVGEDEDMPSTSEVDSIEREVGISALVSTTQGMNGFVEYRGSFVVQGDYPPALLAAWDAFNLAQSPPSDEQVNPQLFPTAQSFILICLVHGGSDLESSKLRSWTEALSVLYQTATICAGAETAIEFEHRDLHWGNVLIRPTELVLPELSTLSLSSTPRKIRSPPLSSLDAAASGLQVTVIDFTLSRAQTNEGIVFDPFLDECVFDGEGDKQFDVYRAMREHTAGAWEGFYPLTNLMWLRYLAHKLLHDKKLKIPSSTVATVAKIGFGSPAMASPVRQHHTVRTSSRAPASVARRARTLPLKKSSEELERDRSERRAYETLVALERMLGEAVEPESKGKVRKGGKGKQKAVVARTTWSSSVEFVQAWREL